MRSEFDNLERALVRDAKMMQSIGHHVCFFVLRESYLELELNKHFASAEITTFWGERSAWRKKLLIREELKKQNISLIHCYDFSSLPVVVNSLKYTSLVSLVLTVAKAFSHVQRGFLLKRMMQRVDRIFVTTRMLGPLTKRFLPVPAHKIIDVGIGLDYFCRVPPMSKREFLYKHGIFHSTCIIGIYIPSMFSVQQFKELRPLIRHVSLRFEKKVHFLFYSPLGWEKRIQYKELYDLLEVESIGEICSFSVLTNFLEHYSFVDIWLCPFKQSVLLDFYLQAVALGIPVLWQRDQFSQQLLEMYPTAGATYKYGDAREFSVILSSLLKKQANITREYLSVLLDLFTLDNRTKHSKLLDENYSRLVRRRERALGKIRKKNL